jgi:exodeoxyribonuclease V
VGLLATKLTDSVMLTEEQTAAVKQLVKCRKQVQVLGGLAGVGKSTIVRTLVDRLPDFAVCAYTGKAAQVLRQKGIADASTIHSLIYRVATNDNGEPADPVEFVLRGRRELGHGGVIVDEASMVSQALYDDLLSFDVPLIFVGDHGQLEPVKASGINLMAKPDIVLERIHRNAGEIALFADWLRHDNDADDWAQKCRETGRGEGKVRVVTSDQLEQLDLGEVDQVICAYNRTRCEVNRTIREHLGLPEGRPAVGDRVICLQNDRKAKVFNGMQGELRMIDGHRLVMRSDGIDYGVRYNPAAFGAEKTPEWRAGMIPFDWAYCVTAHKCVHPDTLVETTEGLLPISKIRHEGTIATPTGPKQYTNLVSNDEPAGALRIVCEDGYEVTVTPDHKVERWNGDRYVMDDAVNLTVGTFMRLGIGVVQEPAFPVVLPGSQKADVRAIRHKLPSMMTDELAEFLGLMVADGTLYRSGFRLVKRYQDVVDRFASLVMTLFGCEAQRFDVTGTPAAGVSSTYLASWLTEIGGMNPNAKDVPECILRSPSTFHKAFLRGLFEDGGMMDKDGVGWYSSRPSVVQKVRIMLLRLGMIVGETVNRPGAVYLYAGNAHRFVHDIGFVSRKKNELGRMDTVDKEVRSAIVPAGKTFVREIKPLVGRSGYSNGMDRGYVSRNTLIEAASNADGELLEHLSEMMAWHHVRVRFIEEVECPSMCVEVPDGHRFLQNGFPHGNSQGSEYDHVLVMEQRCDLWDRRRWNYTAASRAKKRLTWVIQ